MGVGAYTSGAGGEQASACRSGWRCRWAGGGAAVRPVFGLTAVRIKGFYLALTTIAAQFLFHFLVLNLPSSWLGGSNGISLEPATFFGLGWPTPTISIYYLCLVVACDHGLRRLRHPAAATAAPSWPCATTTWPPA
jgi:branched-chain amino acid transport system permease protein